MYLGAHMSVAGGLHRACERAAETGCDVLQLFTKNERQWKARSLSDGDVSAFREARVRHKEGDMDRTNLAVLRGLREDAAHRAPQEKAHALRRAE